MSGGFLKTKVESMHKIAALIALLSFVLFIGSCSKKIVVFKSEPPGANIFLNGSYVGRTPTNHRITDYPGIREAYKVEAELDGYHSCVKVFKDIDRSVGIGYVPDVVFFYLNAINKKN